jgi:hypothetical protein
VLAEVFIEKSPAQLLRADVAKQAATYSKCLIKAQLACEKTGVAAIRECELETGIATAPADPKAKFPAAIAKCDAAVDYQRKAPEGSTSVESYELIGCPGDASGAPGRQRFADMAGYQGLLVFAKESIDTLAAALGPISGCTSTSTCVTAAKTLAAYATAIGKCQTKCENDYAGKKGTGGPTDSLTQCDATGDPAVVLCIEKAKLKLLERTTTWPAASVAEDVLDDLVDEQTDELFNLPDNCS